MNTHESAEIANLGEQLEALRAKGLLWAINRYILHPRGFALTFNLDGDPSRITDVFIKGDGTECWAYNGEDDDDGKARFEAWLVELRG